MDAVGQASPRKGSRLPSSRQSTSSATELAIPKSTLMRGCQSAGYSGTTEFLIARRLSQAQELLSGTDRKLSAIAHATGFANEKYFLRRFRLQVGQPPGAFRAGRSG